MRGAVLLETAAETIGLEELLEHQDVDTIGGLILKILARQPATGDTVELGGYRVLVEGAKGFRILSLLFRPLPPAVDEQVSEVAEP